MKLQEALLKLKNLKSRLAKAEKAVLDSVIHYEDEAPEFVYAEELANHSDLEQEVLILKSRIQETNVKTVSRKYDMTLAELILTNADLRSKIAFTNSLLEKTVSYNHGRLYGDTKTKDTVNKRYAEGYDKKNLRVALGNLEAKKEEIEAEIALLNMRTDLVDFSTIKRNQNYDGATMDYMKAKEDENSGPQS